MKKYLFIAFMAFFCFSTLQAQHNLDLIGQWKREGLRTYDKQAYNDIWAWVDSSGREFAIMGSLDSIYFIEVTNPSNPKICDVEFGRENVTGVHRDFKTLDHYCYAVCDEGSSSLQIFDLQYLPDSVAKVYDSDEFAYRVHNIFIDNERLYMGTVRHWQGNEPMRVLSLKDRTNPQFLADLEAPRISGTPLFNAVHDMYARNDTVYCSAESAGLYSYYLDSAGNFELLANGSVTRYPGLNYNHSSWLSENGEILVTADETHGVELQIFEIDWESTPQRMSSFGSRSGDGSIAHNPFIKDEFVFVSYYHEGLVVFDISDLEIPEKVAQFDSYENHTDFSGMYGCWGVYPFLPSGNILISDQLEGLMILDFSVGFDEQLKMEKLLQVYPNPTAGKVKIELPEGDYKSVTISLVNMQGRVIYKQEWGAGDEADFHIPAGIGSGIYVLNLTGNSFKASKKLRVTRQ